MDFKADLFVIKSNAEIPAQGKVLIAEPFLSDSCFRRSVVLLLDHTSRGSTGIILNKPAHHTLNSLMDDFSDYPHPLPVFNGGPINCDTLFYLHTLSHIRGSIPVTDGLYVNGDFEQIKQYILGGGRVEGKIRFFVGCAGWDSAQLCREVDGENTWLVGSEEADDVMNEDMAGLLWTHAMTRMGRKYRLWSRFPLIPSMN